MASNTSSRWRQRESAILLYATWGLTALTTICMILVMIAGTWVADTASGKRLGLSSLSVVSFNGIVPSTTEPHTFLVKMHFFINAFGWEYPTAPSGSPTAGLVYSSAGRSLSLPSDFVTIGKQLDLDPSSWNCFSPNWGTCSNDFYAAFYRGFPFDYSITLSLIVYLYPFVLVLYAITVEVLIVYYPSALKCRCWVFRRWCPCPKGTKEEIEKLPVVVWDRFRMWIYVLIAFAGFLPVINLMMRGWLLVGYLDRRDPRVGGGMKAQMGAGFLNVAWFGVAAAQVAWLCMFIRFRVSKRATWVEQQRVVATEGGIDDRDVGLEDAEAGPALPPRQYSDEPDTGVTKKPSQEP